MVGILSGGLSTVVTGNGLVLFKLDEIEDNIFNLSQLVCFICPLYLKWLLGAVEQGPDELTIADGPVQHNGSLLEVCCVFLEGVALLTALLVLFPSLFSAQIFYEVVEHPPFKLLESLNGSGEVQLHLLVVFSQMIRCFLGQTSFADGYHLGIHSEEVA